MRHRDPSAGVTLVEVLVVLVLIGIVGGAVGLAVNATGREDTLLREADLLSARLHIAADNVALEGRPIAFLWEPQHYAFRVLKGDEWQAPTTGVLGQTHALPDPLRLSEGRDRDTGQLVIGADMRPTSGQAAVFRLAGEGGQDVRLTFDGITARRVEGE